MVVLACSGLWTTLVRPIVLYVFLFNQLQNSYAAIIITEMICDFKWDFTPFQKSAVQDSFMDKQNKNKKSPILRKLKFPSGIKLSDFEAYKVDFCKQWYLPYNFYIERRMRKLLTATFKSLWTQHRNLLLFNDGFLVDLFWTKTLSLFLTSRIGILFPNLFWPPVIKIILVMEKNF